MKIKICCIQNINEAQMAIEAGANILGLVSQMPSGPGVIDEEKIIKIASTVPETIETFLLTSKINAVEIVQQAKRCGTTGIQIVDSVPTNTYQFIKKSLPNIKIVQVIHVQTLSAVEQAMSIDEYVDAILLDSGDPYAKVRELGGTGRTHNWEISKQLVESVNSPVFLAGGLNPDNVADAVSKVKPYGVDICSGVRTEGKLDKDKLKRFITNVKSIDLQ